MPEMQIQSLAQEDPLDMEMAPHSSILSGKSHEERSLVGYSSWDHQGGGHDSESKQQQ